MTLRMPAEWEKQDAVWLAWPHNAADWPGKFAPVHWAYCEIIRYITRTARVRLIVKNEAAKMKAAHMLALAGADGSKVDFITLPTNRSWLRDSGATVVHDGRKRALLDWRFNAWAKYPNWKRDDKVPQAMAAFLALPVIVPEHKGRRVVLEGGAIEVNGKGTLITTEECLLSNIQCRNPGFTRGDYEQVFHDYLGISHTIWLGDGIAGDDTHGHIDDLVRFITPSTVVTVVEQDKRSKNYAPLKANLKRLNAARDQTGRPLDVAELPIPSPLYFDGQLLPASYANFLIVNKLVLVPTFNDPNDRVALNTLAGLFPNHEVVGIYCGDFILGLGTIHCASQQEPS